jgi:hypothetical protein
MSYIADTRTPGKTPRPRKRRSAQHIAAEATPTRHALHAVVARIAARTGIPLSVVREHAAAAGLGGHS